MQTPRAPGIGQYVAATKCDDFGCYELDTKRNFAWASLRPAQKSQAYLDLRASKMRFSLDKTHFRDKVEAFNIFFF